MLIVLQGLDAAGKDGVVKHTLSAVNPLSCTATAFKTPSAEEAAHDFLWRYHKVAPAKGWMSIFNRSHYEAVLVERVHKLVPKKVWSKRYEEINAFERLLQRNGTTVIKLFLHMSKEEQLERFKDRLDDPQKRWKISEADYEERQFWDDYMEAYEAALTKTSTKNAPWYVVPSDHKHIRNFLASQIIADTLEELKISRPKPSVDLAEIRKKYHEAQNLEARILWQESCGKILTHRVLSRRIVEPRGPSVRARRRREEPQEWRAVGPMPKLRAPSPITPRTASARTWRCAPIRRGCSAAIRGSCCMAGATPRSRPGCATSMARRSGCSASRAAAPTSRPSSPPAIRPCASNRCCACARSTGSATRTWSKCAAGGPSRAAPRANPSVETLLHAFMPHKFVDHTHAVASVSIADQPDAEEICRRIYADRLACVPYILPGFGLAKAAAAAFDANPRAEGLMLIKHGIFSFGATAREAYERMIEFVTLAENYIAATAKPRRKPLIVEPQGDARELPTKARLFPILRGAFGEAAGTTWNRRWIFDLREGPEVDAFLAGDDLFSYATRGPVTPDHIIRLKANPLFLDRRMRRRSSIGRKTVTQAVTGYVDCLRGLFRAAERTGRRHQEAARPAAAHGRHPGRRPSRASARARPKRRSRAISSRLGCARSSTPRRSAATSRSARMTNSTWNTGRSSRRSSERRRQKRLARHVVAVTGGAGAIGAATAKAFATEGADIAILDIDAEAAPGAAKAIGSNALGLGCDVTDRASVEAAFAKIVETFGGVDILVSNAGAAMTGMIAELPDEVLRRSFEINFFSHQNVARAAVAVMKAQKLGGILLFNVSKQAVNPGANFGAYGTSKAALLALMRQYALEHGKDGIRVNALNPDRIRSGLLTPQMIAARATARGVSEDRLYGGQPARPRGRAPKTWPTPSWPRR